MASRVYLLIFIYRYIHTDISEREEWLLLLIQCVSNYHLSSDEQMKKKKRMMSP